MVHLSEVKIVLRSILISTPVVIDVYQLNKDFKQQEGFEIPYYDFGHKSLIDFLKSIPDVLIISGNSEHSEVTPVSSKKSSHVNDLVLRQKTSSKNSGYSRNLRKARIINNKLTSVHSPAPQNRKPEVISKVEANSGYPRQKSNSDKSTNVKPPSPANYNSSSCYLTGIKKRLNSSNKDMEGFSKYESNINIINPGTVVENTNIQKGNNSSHVKTSLEEENSLDVDIPLRGREKQADKFKCQGSSIKKTYKRNETIENRSGTKNPPEKNIKSKNKRTNRKCHLMKSAVENEPKATDNKNINETYNTMMNNIPRAVQDNLRNLISDFPEGIWCAELPLIYENYTGKDLSFEAYGYRCLKFLCFDLQHIFHCIQESASDYKLYDKRKPLPEVNIHQDHVHEEITQSCESIPAIPEMIWGSFDIFVPQDAVRLGYKPNRIKVAEVLQADITINVVVTEIYDVSKFWVIIDDSKLFKLIEDMQLYYGFNGTRYLVPKSLLKETLYCVALFDDKFYRAIILNVLPGDEYLKVYYVDFGTLGHVSKSEVWFLTEEFSELPTQAIRARLGDIYPPFEGVTWSPLANEYFGTLTCMKKLIAEIIRVDKKENSVDIKLYDTHSDISNILVNLNFAKNNTQQTHIGDSFCKPRVQYIHHFPTFEDIENWNHIDERENNEFEEVGLNLMEESAIVEKKIKGTVKNQNVSFTNQNIFDIENDEILMRILRQSRMKKSYPI